MMLLCLALMAACPNETALVDRVDLIEINHFYDSQGHHVFDQVIFYDWSQADSRFQVRAWRLLKSNQQLPRMNWQSGRYEVNWRDMNHFRRITANQRHETFTQYDPEILERNMFPTEHRRELAQPIAKKD